MNLPSSDDLRQQIGSMDIYLLDQVLRGHVATDAVILDAGCGGGRNLEYFLRKGHEVFAVDSASDAVVRARDRARGHGRPSDAQHFRVEAVEALSFEDGLFDFVICNAVLHFARDETHFVNMVRALHRVTRKGGICFSRLASSIGIEHLVQPAADGHAQRWHRLPDGSERFLVDLEFLQRTTQDLAVQLVDPIKTVNVQNLRCMTNWVWRKA